MSLLDINFDGFSSAKLHQQILGLHVVIKKIYNFPKKSALPRCSYFRNTLVLQFSPVLQHEPAHRLTKPCVLTMHDPKVLISGCFTHDYHYIVYFFMGSFVDFQEQSEHTLKRVEGARSRSNTTRVFWLKVK